MPNDLWRFESELYTIIDASGAMGKTELRHKFDIAPDHNVHVHIKSRNGLPLSNLLPVSQDQLSFSILFFNGKTQWYKIDNGSVGYLHLHIERGGIPYGKHRLLVEGNTTGETLSNAFDMAKKFLEEKFPNLRIEASEDFHGFSRPIE